MAAWTCPGCGTVVPIPEGATGIIECPPRDTEDVKVPCGNYAFDLGPRGANVPPETPPEIGPAEDIADLLAGISKVGDCGGCTAAEAREFESRFPLLDEIDREFRTSS